MNNHKTLSYKLNKLAPSENSLAPILEAMAADLPLYQILDTITSTLLSESGAIGAGLFLFNSRYRQTYLASWAGGAGPVRSLAQGLEQCEGLPYRIDGIKNDMPWCRADITRDPEWNSLKGELTASGVTSLACVPVVRPGNPERLGSLVLYFSQSFSDKNFKNFFFQVSLLSATATQKLASHSALIESRRLLDALLQFTTALVFVKDLEGRFLMANQHFINTFQKDESIIGKTDFDIFPEKFAEQFRTADLAVYEAGTAMQIEEEAPHGDETHYYLSTKVPLRDEKNAIYAIAGIASDITHIKKAQEELEKVGALKSQFLANMSHEIRTPMNGVLTATEILLETQLNEEQKELTSVIRDSGASLMQIINDVLDLSKIEAGKLDIVREPFEVGELLRRIKNLHSPLCNEKGLNFSIHHQLDLPMYLEGDVYRVWQILNNLLGNAEKFTKSGGSISLQLSCEPGEETVDLQFAVTDTGIGIPEDRQLAIFGAFQQADSSITRQYGGTGLGLSIIISLLELMDGRLSFSSKVNQGSNFIVTLPFRSSNEKDYFDVHFPERMGPDSSRARPLRILVAEDNRTNQILIRRMLERRGHSVVMAANGKEAIELFKQHPFDVILMDIQMPVLSGDLATAQIREMPGGTAIPIIGLTAHAMKGDRERYLECGMDDYVTKPIQAEIMFNVLARHCRSTSSRSIAI